MGMTLQVSKNFQIGGKSFQESQTVTSPSGNVREASIPAAQGGSLTTRSSGTAGTLTMTSGSHGITTGEIVDLYWTDATSGKQVSCRGVTVGTVSGTSVPITTGTFSSEVSALPPLSTAVKVGLRVAEAFALDGDSLEGLTVYADKQAIFVFADGSGTEQFAVLTKSDKAAWAWYTGCPDVNPLAGDTVTQVFMSHGDSAAAATMRVAALLD